MLSEARGTRVSQPSLRSSAVIPVSMTATGTTLSPSPTGGWYDDVTLDNSGPNIPLAIGPKGVNGLSEARRSAFLAFFHASVSASTSAPRLTNRVTRCFRHSTEPSFSNPVPFNASLTASA